MAQYSGLIYGPTGSFKTTAIGHFARYIAERTGKATALFSSDGGGWTACDEEVEAGMIEPFRCDANVPLPILRRVSQGYWPDDAEKARTGEAIENLNFRKMDFEKFGGIAVEGLSSISRMVMRHLADRGIKTGEDATSKFSQKIVVDGAIVDEQFAANSKGHYGFMANIMYGLVSQFLSLPVHYVLFTAHEKKSEDDARRTEYGPGIEGKVSTPLVPTWVGDCIHAQDYAVRKTVEAPDPADPKKMVPTEIVQTVCRYYFTKHPDPDTGIMFPAKPRVTHSKVDALLKAYPGGFFVPTPAGGFDQYLKTIDRLKLDVQDEGLDAWRKRRQEKIGRSVPAAAATTMGTK